jgi:hypothetical protein
LRELGETADDHVGASVSRDLAIGPVGDDAFDAKPGFELPSKRPITEAATTESKRCLEKSAPPGVHSVAWRRRAPFICGSR